MLKVWRFMLLKNTMPASPEKSWNCPIIFMRTNLWNFKTYFGFQENWCIWKCRLCDVPRYVKTQGVKVTAGQYHVRTYTGRSCYIIPFSFRFTGNPSTNAKRNHNPNPAPEVPENMSSKANTENKRASIWHRKLSTFKATSDDKVVKLTIFCFQCRTSGSMSFLIYSQASQICVDEHDKILAMQRRHC